MTRFIAIIHARITSSRLPGKVLKKILGKSVLYHHVERMRMCPDVSNIILATTKNSVNLPLIEEAKNIGIDWYQGAEEDVVQRYLSIGKNEKADVIVRCGCDKPLFSYEAVNALIDTYVDDDFLTVSTPLSRGLGSELLSVSAIERIYEHYHGPAIAKHIYEYPHLYKTRSIEIDDEFSRPEFRLTLDTEEDFKLISHIYDLFYQDKSPVNLLEVFKYLDDNPSWANLNRFTEEKEINHYIKDLAGQPAMTIHLCEDGTYIIKNRMGQVIDKEVLKSLLYS
jgi:spore coat polysaccharide biosynthesis protein SpsF